MNFLKGAQKKKEEIESNSSSSHQSTQSQQYYPISPPRDGSVALYFASPHDIPKQLRDALTGFDAASTYLTEKEIKQLELVASALEDLELALSFRPCEIDRLGLHIIKTQMQKHLYAKLRLNKSRYGQILQLTVKTIQEFKHFSADGNGSEGGRKGWFRRWL